MKILFASAEGAPFFKTGGLGDVAYALPKELKRKLVDVRVVLPLHRVMPQEYKDRLEDVTSFYVTVGWRNQYCGIKRLVLENVTYYFVDNEYYFGRDVFYGYFDDGERYAFFNMAILEMLEKIDFVPDIIHVNDFHTAMVPVLLKEKYRWIEAYSRIKTVLTIHNIQFQGIYDSEILVELFDMEMDLYYNGTLRYDDGVSFLKGGIIYADRVTTVSPSYAEEIQTPAFGEGLDSLLRKYHWKLSGIINGIDYDVNNPETDTTIPATFSIEDLSGKKVNKQVLQERMGLPVNSEIPVISMVSRLTNQKGCQLILDQLEVMLQRNLQVVVLGTGDPHIEDGFRYFAARYPKKISVSISFDIQLAQLMYAGSDMFLMPSAFEPCGLSQLIAMRYGSLPIVHEIGGLRDTVMPYNETTETGTGFGFEHFNGALLTATIDKGNALYWDSPDIWKKIVKEAMAEDFSWGQPSQSYISLYQDLMH